MINTLSDISYTRSQYLFLSIFTVYLYFVGLPFILFEYNKDLNIKFFISLSIFLVLIFFIISNVETKIKQFTFPILIMNVPGAIDNFFPSFPSDIYTDVSLPISVISYLDLFIVAFFLSKIFIYKEKIEMKLDYFKIIFLLISVIYSLIFIFIHINSEYNVNAYAGILLFFRMFFLLLIIDNLYINKNINLKYFYLGFVLSFVLLLLDAFVYSYIFTDAPHLNHSTFANNVFANIIVFYYAIYLIYFKKNSLLMFSIVAATLIFTAGKAATLSFLLLFILLYYVKNIIKYKQVFKYLFIFLSIFIIYLFIRYLNSHDFIHTFSSLYTRGILWGISIEMFFDHIFQGTGYWTWNSYKYDYDFLELGIFDNHTLWSSAYLLDAHNGYLHILAEFGIIIWTLLYSLFYYVYKRIDFYYFIPFLIWLITEITNAGINKHQIFVFVIFLLYLTYKTKNAERYK